MSSKKQVPNATIDGKVGRQLNEANALISSQYQSFAKPNKDVVMQLGTNGAFTDDQVNEIIDNLGKAQIYFRIHVCHVTMKKMSMIP